MKKRSGYILILTILIMASLIFFGIIYLSLYKSRASIARRAEYNLIAEAGAKAGIDDAIYYLKRNPAWTSGFNNEPLPHSGATYSMSFDPGQVEIPYSTNNSHNVSPTTGYGGRAIPAGAVHLVSVGKFKSSKKIEQAIIFTRTSFFSNAAFVAENMELSGNVKIDSWNSSGGSYNQTKKQSGGDIGTNSGENNVVSLSGNVKVYGNVKVGPGESESSSIKTTGNSSYQSASVASARISLPFQQPPAGTNQGKRSNSVYGPEHFLY